MKLDKHWYQPRAPIWLIPLSWLFRALAALRRFLFNVGVFRSYKLDVPVIVVGNIAVGGTGKTPLVIWIVKLLKKAGYRPGVITRGYGGSAQRWPQQVRKDSDPSVVGDEPVLLALHCDCPIAAAPDRVAAANSLMQHNQCDVLVSDDGLQHYRMQRDIEIVVVDGERRFGNGHCLPAGPLRETVSRLTSVDYVVTNGVAARHEFSMKLQPGTLRSVVGDGVRTLADFAQQEVHAVAGIGNPRRFFELLKRHGLVVTEHAFPDHHAYSDQDLQFGDDMPILMTEKDAVKCREFADVRGELWYLPVEANLNESFAFRLLEQLKKLVS